MPRIVAYDDDNVGGGSNQSPAPPLRHHRPKYISTTRRRVSGAARDFANLAEAADAPTLGGSGDTANSNSAAVFGFAAPSVVDLIQHGVKISASGSSSASTYTDTSKNGKQYSSLTTSSRGALRHIHENVTRTARHTDAKGSEKKRPVYANAGSIEVAARCPSRECGRKPDNAGVGALTAVAGATRTTGGVASGGRSSSSEVCSGGDVGAAPTERVTVEAAYLNTEKIEAASKNIPKRKRPTAATVSAAPSIPTMVAPPTSAESIIGTKVTPTVSPRETDANRITMTMIATINAISSAISEGLSGSNMNEPSLDELNAIRHRLLTLLERVEKHVDERLVQKALREREGVENDDHSSNFIDEDEDGSFVSSENFNTPSIMPDSPTGSAKRKRPTVEELSSCCPLCHAPQTSQNGNAVTYACPVCDRTSMCSNCTGLCTKCQRECCVECFVCDSSICIECNTEKGTDDGSRWKARKSQKKIEQPQSVLAAAMPEKKKPPIPPPQPVARSIDSSRFTNTTQQEQEDQLYLSLQSIRSGPRSLHRFIFTDVSPLGMTIEKRLLGGTHPKKMSVVCTVNPNSAAELHGVQSGDVICKPGTDGEGLEGTYDLFLDASKNRPIMFEVVRPVVLQVQGSRKGKKRRDVSLPVAVKRSQCFLPLGVWDEENDEKDSALSQSRREVNSDYHPRVASLHRFVITRLGSIGLTITRKSGTTIILNVETDSIGEEHGLRKGDILRHPNSPNDTVVSPTTRVTTNDAYEWFRGAVGSSARPLVFEILRPVRKRTVGQKEVN